MVGADCEVDCFGGARRRYVNLDNAASTPVLAEVLEAVEAFVPSYGSVHRGTGYKSQVATAAYEAAREAVGRFVGARRDDSVVLVRNTTEAINVLSAALPPSTRVLSTRAEHHANMLPWRGHDLRLLPFTRTAGELREACDRALREERIDLVAVTGASNVTGRAGRRPPLPGAVRASIGLGTTPEDVDRLAAALEQIAHQGLAAR